MASGRFLDLAWRHQAAASTATSSLISRFLPWINGAALTGCAVFSYPGQIYVLVGLMLFLPLMDSRWKPPALPQKPRHIMAWVCLILIICGLLFWRPQYLNFALSTLLLAALPEEWFFRGYFMIRTGGGWRGNIIASLLFSLLHGLTRDWSTALLVFLPSIFYGWLYQRTRDLPLLVLVHALSNVVYVLFIARLLKHL